MQEFYNFLSSLPLGVEASQHFHRVTAALDTLSNGEIFVPDFTKSFSSYLYYEEILRDQIVKPLRQLANVLRKKRWSANDLDRAFVRYSEFGFVQKHKFMQLLAQILGIPEE